MQARTPVAPVLPAASLRYSQRPLSRESGHGIKRQPTGQFCGLVVPGLPNLQTVP